LREVKRREVEDQGKGNGGSKSWAERERKEMGGVRGEAKEGKKEREKEWKGRGEAEDVRYRED
jgi:hypothetical protein